MGGSITARSLRPVQCGATFRCEPWILSCFSMAAMILRCVAMDDALRLSVCNDSSRLRLNISINPETSFCSAWFRVARLMEKCSSASASTPVSPRLTASICLATIFFSCATSFRLARSAAKAAICGSINLRISNTSARAFFSSISKPRQRPDQRFNRQIGDEIAHAGSADDESLGFQCAKRLAHRSPADFESFSQLALRGKLITGLEPAVLDQLMDLVEDVLVNAGFLNSPEHWSDGLVV